MSDGERQGFVRELWRALPADVLDSPAVAGRGRLVISCRAHYFPTIHAQSSGYLGQDRGDGKLTDYAACVMLPWQQEQVEEYLRRNLGPERAARCLEIIATVHNLPELSQRPYLLKLIADECEHLELDRAAGRTINAATLYEKFTARWLHRDDGKHVFTPEHKRLLMERLAADLWRDNAREWPWERVAAWLDQFLHDHPVIASRYARDGVTAHVLNQDFRTATFFLRPDASGDGFRFARTSLQEYFLAAHLVRALGEKSAAAAWALPLPSHETCDFAGQLLEIQPARDRAAKVLALDALLAAGESPAQARRAALHYLRIAHAANLPLPDCSGVNMTGLDLEAWEFIGEVDRPLRLGRVRAEGAVLVRAKFHFVEMADSLWRGADLRGAEFLGCALERADLRETRLDALLRACTLAGSEIAGAEMAGLVAELPAWDAQTEARWREALGPERARLAAPLPPAHPLLAASAAWSLGHSRPVTSVALSSDGTRLVSKDVFGNVRVWEAESGAELPVTDAARRLLRDGSKSEHPGRHLTISPLDTMRWTNPDGVEFDTALLPDGGFITLERQHAGDPATPQSPWRFACARGEYWRHVLCAEDTPPGRTLHSADALGTPQRTLPDGTLIW